MKVQRLLFMVLFVLSATALVNCSNVNFGHSSGSPGVQAAGGPVGGTNGGLGTNGGPGGASGGGDATGQLNQPNQPGGGDKPPGTSIGDPNNGGILVGGGPGGTDSSNAGGPGTTPTGSGNTSSAILPKVQFIGPTCERLTNCAIIFRLDKAYPQATEFNWRTDDTLYGTPAPAGQPMWGQAGYHYVSTSGHVVFAPGVTEQVVHVRNINPDNVAISIGVIMSQCEYNRLLESCQKFFSP